MVSALRIGDVDVLKLLVRRLELVLDLFHLVELVDVRVLHAFHIPAATNRKAMFIHTFHDDLLLRLMVLVVVHLLGRGAALAVVELDAALGRVHVLLHLLLPARVVLLVHLVLVLSHLFRLLDSELLPLLVPAPLVHLSLRETR